MRLPRVRFTLLDGMALIAAAGAGLATLRYWLASLRRTDYFHQPLYDAARAGAWVPLYLAMALLALRCRPPRPRWRRVARQPGFVACLAVVVAVAAQAAWMLEPIAHDFGGRRWQHIMACVSFVPCAAAVGAAWLTLWLTGTWRPEASWIDRAGRVIGAGYVLLRGALAVARFFPAIWF